MKEFGLVTSFHWNRPPIQGRNIGHLPVAKTLASNCSIYVVERVITYCSPRAAVVDFQTSFVRQFTACQSHYQKQQQYLNSRLWLCRHCVPARNSILFLRWRGGRKRLTPTYNWRVIIPVLLVSFHGEIVAQLWVVQILRCDFVPVTNSTVVRAAEHFVSTQ